LDIIASVSLSFKLHFSLKRDCIAIFCFVDSGKKSLSSMSSLFDPDDFSQSAWYGEASHPRGQNSWLLPAKSPSLQVFVELHQPQTGSVMQLPQFVCSLQGSDTHWEYCHAEQFVAYMKALTLSSGKMCVAPSNLGNGPRALP
jgi:hypothetical protein